MGGTGFSIKVWRWHYENSENTFRCHDTSTNFIFQDQTLQNLNLVGELISKLSSSEELFQEAYNRIFKTEEATPIKGEVDPLGGDVKLEPQSEEKGDTNEKKSEPASNLYDVLTNVFQNFPSADSDSDEKQKKSKYPNAKKRRGAPQTKGKKLKKKRTGPKTCNNCQKGFVWRKNFLSHLEECNPEQLKEADTEGFTKTTKVEEKEDEYRNKYYNRKTPKGPFHCDRCPQVFQKFMGFLSHLKAHDLSAAAKRRKTVPLEGGEEGDGEERGKGAVAAAATPTATPTTTTTKTTTTTTTNSATDSSRPEEGLKLTEMRDGVLMRCDKCDLAYSTFQMYKNHMDQFHKKSLSCSDCGLKFTLKNTLIKHRLDYHTLYPKACDDCDKVCLTAKDLVEHLQTHNADFIGKTSPCEICGKLLKNKYSLKAHVEAVHDKKRGGDFTCDQCGKILKSKASLEYHKKSVHTQEYPFRCEMCGKGFIKYNRMINCINNHQGIYKYRCPDCEYKTNKLLQFKEHVNSHTGEKSFFCPACEHQSNGTKNLGCHTKQVHKLTLCQAEISYKRNRYGQPMTDDEIEDLKLKMTSLHSYDEKINAAANLKTKNSPSARAENRSSPAPSDLTIVKNEQSQHAESSGPGTVGGASGGRRDGDRERYQSLLPHPATGTTIPLSPVGGYSGGEGGSHPQHHHHHHHHQLAAAAHHHLAAAAAHHHSSSSSSSSHPPGGGTEGAGGGEEQQNHNHMIHPFQFHSLFRT